VTTSSLPGNVYIDDYAGLEFNQSMPGTYGGVISGQGPVTVTGGGTVTLSGANTYGGGTTISSGTLRVTTSNLPGSVTNWGTLWLDQSFSATFAYDIIGQTGIVVIDGGATITFSGDVTAQYVGLAGTSQVQGTMSCPVLPCMWLYHIDDLHGVGTGESDGFWFDRIGSCVMWSWPWAVSWQAAVCLALNYSVGVYEGEQQVAELDFPAQNEPSTGSAGFKVGEVGYLVDNLEGCDLLSYLNYREDQVLAIDYDGTCGCGQIGDGDFDDGFIRICVQQYPQPIGLTGMPFGSFSTLGFDCFGATLVWTNEGLFTPINRMGAGWGMMQWPAIQDIGAGRVAISAVGQDVRLFDYDSESETYLPLRCSPCAGQIWGRVKLVFSVSSACPR